MVFKRREKRTTLQSVSELIYPRRGWWRALSYMVHRVRRLPDTSHSIARGIGVGVFVCFTPFFGFHFVVAALVCLLIRGNIVASLMSTFFGNPLTFPLIAALSYRLGNRMVGGSVRHEGGKSLVRAFGDAFAELWNNLLSLFNSEHVDWHNLQEFMREVFFPYLVGGIIPGLICGFAAYFLSQPVIGAYQKRRKTKLVARLRERRQLAAKRADEAK